MQNWLKILLILILTAGVYRDSFTARFFQDDKVLLALSQQNNWFAPVPNFPYRPVSIQFFYFLGRTFSGFDPLGYHLLLFGAFALTLVVGFNLGKILLKDETRAVMAVFFYALNVSLFANFYWVATSYFVLGTLFFLSALYFYLQPGLKSLLLALFFFLLALGSNEIAFVFPAVALVVSWYLRQFSSRLWLFLSVDLALFFSRLFLVGLPKAADYTIQINGQFFATFRWYILRVLDLPEGIRFSGNYFLIGLFILFLLSIFLAKINWRLLFFALGWFFLAALPFYFLPGHMSAYYLTLALFGPALFLGGIFGKSKLMFWAMGIYLVLTVVGLDFLARSHWIILKNTGPIGKF